MSKVVIVQAEIPSGPRPMTGDEYQKRYEKMEIVWPTLSEEDKKKWWALRDQLLYPMEMKGWMEEVVKGA